MEDEVFKKELQELIAMLKNLRLIRDREQRKDPLSSLLGGELRGSQKNTSYGR